MGALNSGLSRVQPPIADGSLPDKPNDAGLSGATGVPAPGQSVAQQMIADGSLPDKPENPSPVPMRAVVAAAATTNPDAAARTQQLVQQAGFPAGSRPARPLAERSKAARAQSERMAHSAWSLRHNPRQGPAALDEISAPGS